ncbi:MAG: hypothetical protein IJ739_02790 [Bacteroidaceae bacterium]|nr:hypothetical protein [Bacteroidaceae bacterium]
MKEKRQTDRPTLTRDDHQQDISWFIHFWNQTLDKHQSTIHRLPFLTRQQQTQLRARQAKWGEAAVRQVVINAATSSYLNGRRGRRVNKSIDWYLQPQHFASVLQGKYRDEEPEHHPRTLEEQRREQAEQRAAQLEQRRLDARRIEEEEHRRREQEYDRRRAEAATPDEIKRILGDKWLLG